MYIYIYIYIYKYVHTYGSVPLAARAVGGADKKSPKTSARRGNNPYGSAAARLAAIWLHASGPLQAVEGPLRPWACLGRRPRGAQEAAKSARVHRRGRQAT